jgi:hypothetical protein
LLHLLRDCEPTIAFGRCEVVGDASALCYFAV